MNLIRRMSLSVLVLIILFGVVAYAATKDLHSEIVSSRSLFLIAWGICSVYAAVSWLIIIAELLSGAGPKLRSTLLFDFMLSLVATLVIGAAAAYVCSTVGSHRMDAGLFGVIYVSAIFGLLVSFFALLLLHARSCWFAEASEDGTSIWS